MSAELAFRPTPTLSVYPVPPSGGLMAILKAYFDDSKDNRVLTVAGYLADHESWARFDPAWRAVLDQFEVPYLHMREFWDTEGIYKHIKDDPQKEEAFFSGLVKVICDHLRFCVQTTVVLDDVKKFNRSHKHNLSAHALAIYGCLLRLQTQFNGQSIEVVFDKVERANSLIDLGKHYAEADAQQPLNKRLILSVRVEDGESWRTILPLQAADFVAWEMRKYCNDPLPWIEHLKYEDISSGAAMKNFQDWFTRFVKEEERLPRYRKSFDALKRCRASPDGFLFNFAALELLQYRHPYGWRLSEKRRMALFSGDQGA